jgi:hypothetical protein
MIDNDNQHCSLLTSTLSQEMNTSASTNSNTNSNNTTDFIRQWIADEFPLATDEQLEAAKQASEQVLLTRFVLLRRLLDIQLYHGMWLLHNDWMTDSGIDFYTKLAHHNLISGTVSPSHEVMIQPWIVAGVLYELLLCAAHVNYRPDALYSGWEVLTDDLFVCDMDLCEQAQRTAFNSMFAMVELAFGFVGRDYERVNRLFQTNHFDCLVQSYVLLLADVCLSKRNSILRLGANRGAADQKLHNWVVNRLYEWIARLGSDLSGLRRNGHNDLKKDEEAVVEYAHTVMSRLCE